MLSFGERGHVRANAMVAEELIFVQHLLKDTFESLLAGQSQKTTLSTTLDCAMSARRLA